MLLEGDDEIKAVDDEIKRYNQKKNYKDEKIQKQSRQSH